MKNLETKMNSIEESIHTLTVEIEERKVDNQTRVLIVPRIEEIIKIYPQLKTAQEKNNILKEILEKVVYEKKKGSSVRGFNLTIFPKLPKKKKWPLCIHGWCTIESVPMSNPIK